jgi:hypothetical protein
MFSALVTGERRQWAKVGAPVGQHPAHSDGMLRGSHRHEYKGPVGEMSDSGSISTETVPSLKRRFSFTDRSRRRDRRALRSCPAGSRCVGGQRARRKTIRPVTAGEPCRQTGESRACLPPGREPSSSQRPGDFLKPGGDRLGAVVNHGRPPRGA